MNPYQNLPPERFWRTGVSEKTVFSFDNFWASKWELPQNARFSTYGSCFAQHISRELQARGIPWLNAEPAPRNTPVEIARRFNYGIYSSRTGNIYTVRQLKTWLDLAVDPKKCAKIECFEQDGRFYDSLRPAVEPDGFASEAEMRASLNTTARMFGKSVADVDVFVFTLGLTEGWENAKTKQVYPVCPGTIAGEFDPDLHVFKNYSYPEIMADLEASFKLMRKLNKDLRILLTVSPVPLTATASGQHVLPATTYSKSTLRAIAGDAANAHDYVDYFPSYEVITGQPTRSIFYESNLRSVALPGVDVVMKYFFGGLNMTGAASAHGDEAAQREAAADAAIAAEDLVCEEEVLEAANAS